MKVILVNGSPHTDGCTFRGLKEVGDALIKEGIEVIYFHIGNEAIHGCIACRKCKETHECIFKNDSVSKFLKIAKDADGFIFGSPVYYAGMNGSMKSFLDRAFYSSGDVFDGKVASCIVSARRSGTTATYDEFNKYFGISNMIIVSSKYWNNVHGQYKEQVEEDLEGLQTLRQLGHNFAYILKALDLAKKEGLTKPNKEKPIFTNFVR